MQRCYGNTSTVYGGAIMDENNLSAWRDDVKEHMALLDNLIEHRKFLKAVIEEHLRQVFDWDDIEYNRDMSVVSLTFIKDHQPIIKTENLKNLGMDFQVKAEYDDCANRIVVIDVFPFGDKS